MSGKDNVVADVLSQISEVTVPTEVNNTAIAKAQKDNAELRSLTINSIFPIFGSNSYLFCETSDKGPRPFIPADFHKEVFYAVIDLAHPGTTKRLVTGKYFWPSMNRDVNSWAKQGIACQKCTVNKHKGSRRIPWADQVLSHHLSSHHCHCAKLART